MRKLILITVLMLASASAFAGDTRSLSLASNDVLAASQPTQPTVDRAAVSKVATKLAQAAAPVTTQSDAAPTLPQTTTTTTTQAPAAAPVQTAAPVTTTEPVATTTTTADTKPATKPAKTATTKRESDEHKARRIAAKYGVSW